VSVNPAIGLVDASGGSDTFLPSPPVMIGLKSTLNVSGLYRGSGVELMDII
jgi:hypothetical protein